MESLALPNDLLWNGKAEPASPPPNELFPITESIEEWLIDDDNFATDILLSTDNNVLELKKPGLEFTSSNDDFIIEFYDIKEEQWTDAKSNSPQYLDYNSLGTVIGQPSLITKVQNPYDFRDNNATEYDATILTQLTPPQSPPQAISSVTTNPLSLNDAHNVKEILDFIVQQTTDSSIASSLSQLTPLATSSNSSSADDATSSQSMLDYSAWNNGNDITENTNNFVPFQSEIERETQIVDDIVKSRAKELLDWNDDCDESMSSFSPPSTDEDWTPTSPSNVSSTNESSEYGINNNQCDQSGKSPSATQHLSKKRTRPYGRCPEDRKSRKKEQNKNAATRYRQKKKQEMETLLGEEQLLTQRNDELKKTLADRKREAKYLKTLIREFYQKNKSK